MTISSFLTAPLLLLLLLVKPSLAVVRITTEELREGILNGRWDVVVDTRTPAEWATGHIPNATFLDSLQQYNTSGQVSTPDELLGCSDACTIVVYCASGNRAQGAATVLEAAGFVSPVYNGLGVNDWVEAGFDLVNTTSLVPACTKMDGVCMAEEASTGGGDEDVTATQAPTSGAFGWSSWTLSTTIALVVGTLVY